MNDSSNERALGENVVVMRNEAGWSEAQLHEMVDAGGVVGVHGLVRRADGRFSHVLCYFKNKTSRWHAAAVSGIALSLDQSDQVGSAV